MGLSLRLPAGETSRKLVHRARGLLLALVLEALVLLLFLYLVPALTEKPKPKPTIFGFDIDDGEAAAPESPAQAEKRAGGARTAAVRPPLPTPSPEPVPETLPPADILWLARRDTSALDSAMRSAPAGGGAPGAAGAGPTGGNDSRLAAGHGPRGEPLYAAEWHVRPTDAQLQPYVPARTREGWGEIACRTVEDYRVEDCQELADAPRGSGLAGAVRQAAWQFRVRPPRIGGKAMVGTWVRIRIDYRIGPAEPDRRPGGEDDER